MKNLILYHGTPVHKGFKDPASLLSEGLRKQFCGVSRLLQRGGVFFSPYRDYAEKYADNHLLAVVETDLDVFKEWDIDFEVAHQVAREFIEKWKKQIHEPDVKTTALAEIKKHLQHSPICRSPDNQQKLQDILFQDIEIMSDGIFIQFSLYENSVQYLFRRDDYTHDLHQLGLGFIKDHYSLFMDCVCQAVKEHYPALYKNDFDLAVRQRLEEKAEIAFKYTGDKPLIPDAAVHVLECPQQKLIHLLK